MSSEPLLSVRSLRIESRIEGVVQTIVSGLDLEVNPGETVGIVGESGSGKSMTARALIGLLPRGVHASGEIRYGGHDLLTLSERGRARFRGSEIGLVFQDPFTMLNPLARCGKQITEVLRDENGHRLGREARHAEAVRRLREVGIHDAGVAHRFPFQLSGGMRQRVGIAAALARDPRLLIADEPSTALDVTTQKEILALLKSLQTARGMGLILITHDLRVAFSMCDRVSVLYAGSLLESGPAEALESEPLHPYTLGLLLSEPPANRRLTQLTSIGGPVPRPDEVASVCAFSPRCRWAQPVCLAPVALAEVGPGRESACVRIGEIRPELVTARESAEREVHIALAEASRDAVATVSELRKVFEPASRREGGAAVVAVDGVSLEVGEGESVGLVGESGSGKTTLARCLVGLETPTSGTILVDGLHAENFGRLSDRERRQLRRTVQIIFQDPYSSLNPVMTVAATLKEALAVGGSTGRPDSALGALLERVGLPPSYAHRKPVALSGGERQRVAIARALAVKPRLIVCDEPVSALDVSVQAQILNLLKSVREEFGMSYLFITHDLAVVRQVVERVYVLFRGRVVEAGPVDDVLDNPKHEYTVRLVDSVPRSETEWLRAARG
jgi:peptide/nickel transport system ATP-binding protein